MSTEKTCCSKLSESQLSAELGASKDYTLALQGRSITITQQQFEDGTWQDIIRRAFQ